MSSTAENADLAESEGSSAERDVAPAEDAAATPERVVLTDVDELLFRQVTIPPVNGRPTWEAFKGRPSEDHQVSVDRQHVRRSAEAAYLAYVEVDTELDPTAVAATSHGTLAVSVGELSALFVQSYEQAVVGNAAHCQYDLKVLSNGEHVSGGRRRKICVSLLEAALADGRDRFDP